MNTFKLSKMNYYIMQETITISKNKYNKLKRQAKIDVEFLKELIGSLSDIKTGKVRQVR